MNEYIKRDEAIKALHDLWKEFYIRDEDVDSDSDTECFCGGILVASHTIAKLSPADVIEHRCGKWINVSGSWSPNEKCSVCGEVVHEYNYNYCPNCGADMRSKDDD